MSINYYLKRIPTEKEVNSIIKEINDGNYFNAEDMLNEINTSMIHLGKTSTGWVFHFDSNPNLKEYLPNRKSIAEFIERKYNEGWIFYNDNNDDKVTDPTSFWKMVDDWQADPENNMTREKWFSENPWEKHYSSAIADAEFRNRGYSVKYGEFVNDGFRWSVDSNWS